MAQITLKGNSINTIGNLPQKGQTLPDFQLVRKDLSSVSAADFKGKRVVLNIFPSIDTGVCATSVRKFNEKAAHLNNTAVLCVSRDLPFAQARFCGAEGIENAETLSDFRTGEFGKAFGVEMTDGPLQNLHSRAVVVADENGVILHTEQVNDIVEEPDYDAALAVLK
ncbi:MAG: thiol peroxidase [Cryomorphaceae bacterium]|nr:MAG: thiol peroxidase [Cryomorphaceae bacterium]